jgi:hypothetical protein
VEIGFWPPGDDNERICVTLYINPEGPPTLREVMVQLSWVLDCSFACSAGDGERTYALLSTSAGHGVIESLRERRARRDEEKAQERREAAAEAKARIFPALDECLAAADLPREELVERYRGVNDVMLATLLDPDKRGLIEFLRSVPRELLDELPPEWYEGIKLDWWELAPEQRDLLRGSVHIRGEMSRWTDESMIESAERSQREIHVSIALHPCRAGQGLAVGLSVMDPASGSGEVIEPELPLLPRSHMATSEEADLRLRRRLGEDIADEEIGRAREADHARRTEERERAWRPRAEALLTEHRMLSEGAEARLDSLAIPLSPETACSLWQVQEAVARLSGYHIISDCFWQPARAMRDILDNLPWRDGSHMTAFDVLTLRCATCCGREDPWPVLDGAWSPTLEWGDAGSFLRFRTLARDVCRGGLLSAETLELADRWVEGPLAEVAESDGPAPSIRVPVDVRDLVWLRTELEEAQWRWGGELIYGDPTDRRNAYRHAFLVWLLRTVRENGHTLRMLGQLNDEQWQRLSAEGLHDFEMHRDADGEPIQYDLLRLVPPGPPPPDVIELLRPSMGDPVAILRLDSPGWQDARMLLTVRGKQVSWSTFPTALTIEPPSTAALLESPRSER